LRGQALSFVARQAGVVFEDRGALFELDRIGLLLRLPRLGRVRLHVALPF
jgi:hypothetical protein